MQASNGPIVFQRHFADGDVIAALRVGHVGLCSGRHPFDRAVDFPRHPWGDDLFRVVKNLAAKAAANVGRDNPQFVLRNAEGKRTEQQSDGVRVLARRPQRHLFGDRVPLRHRCAWLQSVRDQPLVDQFQFDHVIGVGESLIAGIFIAQGPGVADVVGNVVMHQRQALFGGPSGIHNGIQRFILYFDQVKRVISDIRAFGYYGGDAIAHVAHLVHRERVTGGHPDVGHIPTAGQRPDTPIEQVLSGENSDDAI
jgi:hypothetical protein